MEFDPRHLRTDRRQLDVVIAMAAALRVSGDVGSAMGAGLGHPALDLVWFLGEGPGRPRPGRARLPPPLALGVSFPVPSPRTILRRRRVRVRRCLLWLDQSRFQFRDPRRHAINQGCLLIQQGILLGIGQAVTRRAIHT